LGPKSEYHKNKDSSSLINCTATDHRRLINKMRHRGKTPKNTKISPGYLDKHKTLKKTLDLSPYATSGQQTECVFLTSPETGIGQSYLHVVLIGIYLVKWQS